jgi:hypothetical protein
MDQSQNQKMSFSPTTPHPIPKFPFPVHLRGRLSQRINSWMWKTRQSKCPAIQMKQDLQKLKTIHRLTTKNSWESA